MAVLVLAREYWWLSWF